ncbi:KH domain-containing protein [Candidatus Collierbacteria bacterium]|nr:KH domain-containing protein [Candidatus Collierbacteria bacterium]
MEEINKKIKKVLEELLKLMGIADFSVEVSQLDENVMAAVTVPQEESGILIGYHGETQAALQYLTGQIVNKGQEKWDRIIVNINGYRDQREAQLKQMANNAADRALSSGNEIEMPFLTPAERRIIHLELSTRPDISSYSEGEGRDRRLVIAPKTADQDKA